MLLTLAPSLKAQEFSAGLDIYSSYIWRGLKLGTGAAFQPSVKFTAGGLTIGGWGSYSTGSVEAPEADLYAGYTFSLAENASLGVTLTDYYFPGTPYFDGNSHFFEPMVTAGLGKLSLTAAYMIYDAAASGSGDLYLEANYTAGPVVLKIGGGNGQYTYEDENEDDKFGISNISIGTSKEIKITDSFSIPVNGSVILSPSTEQLYIVVGISL
jgi:uncharacterized protein (TIGR02001 family)